MTYNTIAIHDGVTGFDGLNVFQGTALVAKQVCIHGGWSLALTHSTLPNDTDRPVADTFVQQKALNHAHLRPL